MVTIGTITTTTWTTIYNHLQTGTYALSTNNIFSAYNDELVVDVGLPFVIIESPSISIGGLNMNSSVQGAKIIFNIHVYHNSGKNCKSLVDEIINKLDTGYKVFATAKMKRPRNREDWIQNTDSTSWSYGDKQRIHKYSMAVNYRFVG